MIFKLPHVEIDDTFVKVKDCFKIIFFEDTTVQTETNDKNDLNYYYK